jgi:hypothetical protein
VVYQVRTVPVIVALISSVIMMCLGTPRQLIGGQVRKLVFACSPAGTHPLCAVCYEAMPSTACMPAEPIDQAYILFNFCSEARMAERTYSAHTGLLFTCH